MTSGVDVDGLGRASAMTALGADQVYQANFYQSSLN